MKPMADGIYYNGMASLRNADKDIIILLVVGTAMIWLRQIIIHQILNHHS